MWFLDPADRSPIKRILLSLTAISALVVGGAAGSARSVPPQPQPLNTYFGNLHSHTSYSDGSGTPAEAYAHARDVAKLHFLALTEHNHAEALGPDNIGIGANSALYNGPGPESLISTARALTRDGQFIALYGQEFSTISTGNHVNVFDVGEVIGVGKGRYGVKTAEASPPPTPALVATLAPSCSSPYRPLTSARRPVDS